MSGSCFFHSKYSVISKYFFPVLHRSWNSERRAPMSRIAASSLGNSKDQRSHSHRQLSLEIFVSITRPILHGGPSSNDRPSGLLEPGLTLFTQLPSPAKSRFSGPFWSLYEGKKICGFLFISSQSKENLFHLNPDNIVTIDNLFPFM